MWKLLRNAVLAAALLAGALKLLVWYEVRQEGVRLVALLAPYAEVHYNSIGADLNGNVDLGGVALTIPTAHAHDVYRADQVSIETPGVFWLLQHTLTSDDTVPAHLAINVQGLQAQAANSFALLDSSWLSPLSLVPFETFGCGVVSRFSIADYQRMGLNPGSQRQRVEYHYDSVAGTLDFSAVLSTPPFSTITLRGDLQRFDPKTWVPASGLRNLHFGQLSADYADDSYLTKRNRFCAQMSSTAPTQFVDQHVAAVSSLLAQHGIVPSTDLLQLYHNLVSGGGHLGVLSLPNATFDASQLSTDTPEELLRQMNITTRLNDAPPVMFRLAFNHANVVHSDTLTVAADVSPAVGVSEIAAAKPPNPGLNTNSPPLPANIPAQATPVSIPAKSTSAGKSVDSKQVANTGSNFGLKTKVEPSAPATIAHAKPTSASLNLDRAEAALPPPRSAAASTTAPEELLPSSPPPQPGSTLALVWKPTIERLPEQQKRQSDHDVIDFAALGAYIGKRVRLLTTAGNKVEGLVLAVDNTSVHLRLNNKGGSADLQMPREAIFEIQVFHSHPAISAID